MYSSQNLVTVIQKQNFSLIIDESTDVSSKKNLALSVRFQKEDYFVCDQFLALIEVQNADSNSLFNAIVDFFNYHGIPFKRNMVGFVADGASIMFGNKNSIYSRIKSVIPHLFILKCICHSLTLTVSHASKVLPAKLQTLLSDIYRYLKYSSKRQRNLQKFQNLFNLPEHRILRLHKIRWLSLGTVVSRFLEQYDALYAFFNEERKSKIRKTTDEAERIFKTLQSRFNLLYLQFLNFIMPLINKRNLEFQSESSKIYELHFKMETLFKTIASYYLDEDYVD